jgi:hypothetical protein
MGINHQGLSIGDPDTLMNRKPRVYNECKLNSKADTLAVSQPGALKADVVNSDTVQLEWSEPEDNGGSPILRYRIFVQQQDRQGSKLRLETPDAKTTYQMKIPKTMVGKDYVVSI